VALAILVALVDLVDLVDLLDPMDLVHQSMIQSKLNKYQIL
jgi:hypothetical protein